MTTRIMGATKVRRHFTEISNDIGETGEPLYITHHRDPRAVLVGYDQFERLIERLEDLEDLHEIREASYELTRPLEEFMAELEEKRVLVPGQA
ncbi:MAG: type II toxin-antitoxin system Phd/YefM family antitoxin [Anaerolineae bacterium]